MTNILTWVKFSTAAVCSAVSYAFGGFDTMLRILLIMALIDYITGVCAAVFTKTLSSKTGFNGILKKIVILCVVSCAHLLGNALGVEQIRSAVIGFYIANEGISIVENAALLGVPMPEKLLSILKQIKDKEEQNGIQIQN